MTDAPSSPTVESLLDKVIDSTRKVVQYMRRRFLWTWLAISILALLTCAALLLGVRGAQNDNAQNAILASSAKHTANAAQEDASNVTLFLRGRRGLPGVPGADGKDGSPGQPGAPGSVLANQVAATAAAVAAGAASGGKPTPGPAGPAGPMGADGPLGPIGPAGNQGVNGQSGAQGAQGDIGPAGDKGNQGDTGEPGNPGPAGAKGDQGPPGPAGADGVTGATGLTGPPGPPGPSGVAASQVVTATSPMNPGNTKTITATCPAATVLLGGGFTIDPQVTQLELQGSSPIGTGWTVTVSEDGLAGGTDWSVTAYVVCSA